MKNYLSVIKENKFFYMIFLVVFAINAAFQVPIQGLANLEKFNLVMAILITVFSLLWILLSAVVLPYTTFRYSVIFNGDRKEGYRRMSQFLEVNVIFSAIAIYSSTWLAYDDFSKIDWLITGSSLDWFKVMLLIAFGCYAMVQTLLYIMGLFYRINPIKATVLACSLCVVLTGILLGSMLVSGAFRFLYLLAVLVVTGSVFKAKAYLGFLKCEFSS